MKKYLSIFLILFAIMATETGCETNNPDETKKGGETVEVSMNFVNHNYENIGFEGHWRCYCFYDSANPELGDDNGGTFFERENSQAESTSIKFTWAIKDGVIVITFIDKTQKTATYNSEKDSMTIDGELYTLEY